jgi:serpin B
MKNMVFLAFCCLLAYASQAQNITEANNKFALNLFQKLANTKSNVFFSPYSISTALFMTAGGARSETEKQMLGVLGHTENSASYHKKFGEHATLVEKKEKLQLSIANSIWMQKGFAFQPSYINLLQQAYKSKLIESNFAANPDAEAKKINKWVEGKTKNKIQNLIKPGVLKPNTKMVLVNAIYFFGAWDKEFLKENTRKDKFYLDNNSNVQADFMNNEYKMNYASDNDFELVSIPYMKGEASMLIFLPKKKGNFSNAIQQLSYDKYRSLNNALTTHKVNLTIPKFTMTSEFNLGNTLSEMGMPLAFTDAADFSGMNGKKDLKIDKVIHKAFVDVSEKGTEAAAATAVIVTIKSAMIDQEKIIYFKADHPYIFMIKDNATGQILFTGILNNPVTE